jgi:hypothetical protein
MTMQATYDDVGYPTGVDDHNAGLTGGQPMPGRSDDDRKLDELDRLLNDPDVPMQPELVWRLLDELSTQSRTTGKPRGEARAG